MLRPSETHFASQRASLFQAEETTPRRRSSERVCIRSMVNKVSFPGVRRGRHPFSSFADILSPFFAFVSLFRPNPALVWCRSPCSLRSANITWCINIAYLDRVVETCVRLGEDGQIVTNSTCEAELVGVPSVLDLPSVSSTCCDQPTPMQMTPGVCVCVQVCTFAGDTGCLAMANLDWFYEGSLMTCTVESETCSSKSFTTLLTTS